MCRCFINLKISTKNAQNRNRTSDTRIFSPLLYQLSYLGPSCEALFYFLASQQNELYTIVSVLSTGILKFF